MALGAQDIPEFGKFTVPCVLFLQLNYKHHENKDLMFLISVYSLQTKKRTDQRGSVKTFHDSMSDHSDCEI